MEKKGRASAKRVKWRDVKKKVIDANPAFGNIIDKMNPGDDLDLYLVRYPYGSAIIKNGYFYFPLEDGTLALLDDPRISDEIREKLDYDAKSIPMGVVLHHSVELFIPTEDRIIPFGMMMKGKIFALWGVLNLNRTFLLPKIWSMTAGARSIFLLPKFSDSFAYKKLVRATGIKLPLPRRLIDHGPIMAQMTQRDGFTEDWYTEMLFFPVKWLKEQSTEAWKDFHRYLLQEGWDNSEYWRNKVSYDLIWDLFLKNLAKKGIKVSPRTADIVKHLIALSLGALPGFSPAIDDETGPIKTIQKDLQQFYGFKDLFPTILVPKHYSISDKRSVYWSLQYPTYFESYPKLITKNSALVELRDIHYVLDHFCHEVLHGKIEGAINTTIFYDLIKKIEFDFFHNESDPEGVIRLSGEIPKEDNSFLQNGSESNERAFAIHGTFVRGCVRISVKNTKDD